jgi:hypothetical protein
MIMRPLMNPKTVSAIVMVAPAMAAAPRAWSSAQARAVTVMHRDRAA